MPGQHYEVVNCQRRKVTPDVVLSDIPLHLLLQDHDPEAVYMIYSSVCRAGETWRARTRQLHQDQGE